MSSFDSLAPTYDADFTHSKIGTHLRHRVHQRLLEIWQAGQHVLEVGCGTGEDAHFLGSHDIQVTATDVSPNMLHITQEKTAHLSHVAVQQLDLSQLPNDFNTLYDGVLSNFGALNCIDDWKPLAKWLSKRVKSGGTLTFAVMAPYCVWEPLWHGIHLDLQTATRRWRSFAKFTPDEHTELNIVYPSVNHMTQDFVPYFERTRIQPLGLFLPPSDVYPVIEKRPALLRLLIQADDRLSNIAQLANFADHYWIEFKRV